MSAYMQGELNSLVFRSSRETQCWLSPDAGRSRRGALDRSNALATPNWFGMTGPHGDNYGPGYYAKVGNVSGGRAVVSVNPNTPVFGYVPLATEPLAPQVDAPSAQEATTKPFHKYTPPATPKPAADVPHAPEPLPHHSNTAVRTGTERDAMRVGSSKYANLAALATLEDLYSPVKGGKTLKFGENAKRPHPPKVAFGASNNARNYRSARYDVPDRRSGPYAASYATNYAANYTANYGECRRQQPALQIKIADKYAPSAAEAWSGGMADAPSIDVRSA